MHIGDIASGAALAPMAGISDRAMRRLCAEYGAAFTVSEMVSAKALTMRDAKSFRLLRDGGNDAPYGVQLFGNEPDVMYDAVKCIEGEYFDFLDINMGCPAPKVCNNGSGSGLLRTPELAGEIAKAAVKASVCPVTVKIRIGWDDDTMTGLEVAKRCEDAGVVMLAVHARTRAQQYMPGVNHKAVEDIKSAVSIPVLYNGDVDSAESAKTALQNTGCDGVMVGRAAMGNPFLFSEIKAMLLGQDAPQPPTLTKRFAVLESQVREMCEEKGEECAMRQARKVAAGYVRGLRGAAALRRCAHSLTVFTDLEELSELAWAYNSTV